MKRIRKMLSLLYTKDSADETQETKKVVDSIMNVVDMKNKSIDLLKSFVVASNLAPLNFAHANDEGFVYYEGIFIKDITPSSLVLEGVTMLKVKSEKKVIIDTHLHDTQSQLIYVQRGAMTDLVSGLTFTAGKSFFVVPGLKHDIQYGESTEALIYYAPSLVEIKK